MGVCAVKNKEERKNKNNRRECKNKLLTNEIFIINHENINPEVYYEFINNTSQDHEYEIWTVKHKITGLIRTLNKVINIETLKLFNEYEILLKIDHPNIVKVIEKYSYDNTVGYITEHYEQLFDLLKNKKVVFSEKKSALIIYQIMNAINYLHINKIIHRNLSLENILVSSTDDDIYYVKLSGFKVASFKQPQMHRKVIGSLYYIAPDVLNKNYNEKCDIWSIGVILFSLLSGKFPFEGSNEDAVFDKIKRGHYEFKSKWNLSDEAKDLICRLLEMNHEKRITIREALNHKFFIKNEVGLTFLNLSEEKKKLLLENFVKYNNDNEIYNITMGYMVHMFSHLNEVKDCIKLFRMFDKDENGIITKQEVYLGFKKYLKNPHVEALFNKIENSRNFRYEDFIRNSVDRKILFGDDEIRLQFALDFINRFEGNNYTLDDLRKILNL
jgi:calcium-dependent protein kinase